MKIKFLWFWSILATLTVFVLGYFLQVQQDEIVQLQTKLLRKVLLEFKAPSRTEQFLYDRVGTRDSIPTEVKLTRLRSLKSFLPLEAKIDSISKGMTDCEKDFDIIRKMSIHLGGDIFLLRKEMGDTQPKI